MVCVSRLIEADTIGSRSGTKASTPRLLISIKMQAADHVIGVVIESSELIDRWLVEWRCGLYKLMHCASKQP